MSQQQDRLTLPLACKVNLKVIAKSLTFVEAQRPAQGPESLSDHTCNSVCSGLMSLGD